MNLSLRLRLRQRRWARQLQRALFRGIEGRLSGLLQSSLQMRIESYQERLRRDEPLPDLSDVELRVFSQNGEDGILIYLLAIGGWETRRFLEIGIQDGWECNCAILAKHLGWDGWFVEGDATMAALARQQFGWDPGSRGRRVEVVNQYVTRENAANLTAEHGIEGVDVLSIDIDGMDYWVWDALEYLRARIVIVEYNAAFGAERSVTVPYQPVFDRWSVDESGLYYGASLAALERLGVRLGFRLIGCNSTGVNAFFLREDLIPNSMHLPTVTDAFRENVAQNRLVPFDRQFPRIEHLPVDSI